MTDFFFCVNLADILPGLDAILYVGIEKVIYLCIYLLFVLLFVLLFISFTVVWGGKGVEEQV